MHHSFAPGVPLPSAVARCWPPDLSWHSVHARRPSWHGWSLEPGSSRTPESKQESSNESSSCIAWADLGNDGQRFSHFLCLRHLGNSRRLAACLGFDGLFVIFVTPRVDGTASARCNGSRHLGLVTPPGAVLNVGSVRNLQWAAGRALVWDDAWQASHRLHVSGRCSYVDFTSGHTCA